MSLASSQESLESALVRLALEDPSGRDNGFMRLVNAMHRRMVLDQEKPSLMGEAVSPQIERCSPEL